MREVVIGGIYRHFKGHYYIVLNTVLDSKDCSILVLYRALYSQGDTWTRPIEEFLSEVPVGVKSNQQYRFEQVTDFSNKLETVSTVTLLEELKRRGNFPLESVVDIKSEDFVIGSEMGLPKFDWGTKSFTDEVAPTVRLSGSSFETVEEAFQYAEKSGETVYRRILIPVAF